MLSVVQCVIIGLAVQSVLASGSGHSGYVVSTDYTSRYHGPGASPVVLSDGTLADTPEVAAARAAHLTALTKAQALWYGGSIGNDYGSYGSQSGSYSGSHSGSYSGTGSISHTGSYSGTQSGAHTGSYSGGHSGSYPGTGSGAHVGSYPGVSSLSSDVGKAGSYGSAWSTYSGPLASATVLPSGYLADSSDVAAAKIAHLGAVAQAYAEAAKWPAESGNNQGWKQW